MLWQVYIYDWVGLSVICRRGLRVLVDADGNRSFFEPQKALVEVEAEADHKQTSWLTHVRAPVDFVHASICFLSEEVFVVGYFGVEIVPFVALGLELSLTFLFGEY